LKWSAARMAPKSFGDRMEVNHSAEGSYLDALKAVQGRMDDTNKLPNALHARDADSADEGRLH